MQRGLGKVQRHFLLSLIVPTEALQEPRWLGILHGLDLRLCILHGPDLYPCILLAPYLCSGIFQGPDLCSGIMLGPHMCAGIFHGPDLRSGIYDLCLVILDLGLGILYGLHGPDLCLCIFLRCPSLELLEHGLGWWLRIFGLTPIGSIKGGSNFGARRCLPCSRRQSLSAGG
jgi:hypothetical protein